MNIATLKGPPGQKEPKKGRDPKYMEQVAQLPCVICTGWGLPQLSPTQVHHCIHGRYSAKRAPDCMTIPICEGHHLGMFDTSKIAIHREPSKWKRLYGPDTGFIAQTQDFVERMRETL